MDNEIVQEVLNRLDAVGEAVTNAAGQGFELLVRQQIVVGVSNLVWSLVWLAIAVTTALTLRRTINKFRSDKLGQNYTSGYGSTYTYDWTDFWIGDDYGPAPVLGSFVVVGTSFIFLSLVNSGVKHIVNPGYYAIEEILRSL